jgi:hypothetical protein
VKHPFVQASDSDSDWSGSRGRRQPLRPYNQVNQGGRDRTQSLCGTSNTQQDGKGPAATPESPQAPAPIRESTSTPTGPVEAALARAQRPAVSRLVVDMLTPNLMFTQPPV